MKFTMQGSISIFVSYKFETNKLIFRVADTGIGIKDEDAGKLFALFGKINVSKNMNTEGIGLGLNISKKIVNALGSEIALDKNYSNGACF